MRFAATTFAIAIAASLMIATDSDAEEVKGTITNYICGDNCYLTITREAGAELTALCAADVCDPWNAKAGIPGELIGEAVVVEISQGVQVDGEGSEVSDFPAFSRIQFTSKTMVPAGNRSALEDANCERLRSIEVTYAGIETAFGMAITDWTEEDFRLVRERLVECAPRMAAYANYDPAYVDRYIDEALEFLRQKAISNKAVSEYGDLQDALLERVQEFRATADAGELSSDDLAALERLKQDDADLRRRFLTEPTTRDSWAVTSAIDEAIRSNESAIEQRERKKLEEEWDREEALRPDTRARADADALYYMYQIADLCGRAGEVWSADAVSQLQQFIVPFLQGMDDKTKEEAWGIASQRFQVVASRLTVNDCAYAYSYFQGLGYQASVSAGRPPF